MKRISDKIKSSILYDCMLLSHNIYNMNSTKDYEDRDLVGIHFKSKDDTEYTIYMKQSEKLLLVVFRGTTKSSIVDIMTDLKFRTTEFKDIGRCHRGFNEAYTKVGAEMSELISEYIAKYDIKKVTFTGHSLGGALATLAYLDFMSNGKGRTSISGRLITFGSPRVFIKDITKHAKLLLAYSVRIIHDSDIVPKCPPKWFRIFGLNYTHYGVAVKMGIDKECTDMISDHRHKYYLSRLTDDRDTIIKTIEEHLSKVNIEEVQ